MKKTKKSFPSFINYLASHSKTPDFIKTELAEEMGISRQALHYFLKDTKQVKLKHLKVLQRFFALSDNEFYNLLNRYLKMVDQNTDV